MDSGVRRDRFKARVALERLFLAPVNASFGSVAPLTGMTTGAIENWEARAARFRPAGAVKAVAELLHEASRRADLLADHSRDVFDGKTRPDSSSLQDMLRMLVEKLKSE